MDIGLMLNTSDSASLHILLFIAVVILVIIALFDSLKILDNAENNKDVY